MCGISVILSLRRQQASNDGTNAIRNGAERLAKSLDLIQHRGPDARGIWVDPTSTVALGHCRLSIIDLTPAGNQPLHDDEGHIHAVVNGEIYDHDRLRRECAEGEAGYKFQGSSDSELALALYKRYGSPAFLEHCRGEFAMVIYDDRSGDVVAVRDRFGIKPLYYTVCGDEMLIASEMKAFLPLGWKPEWDVGSIALRMSEFGEFTAFKEVRHVKPGHYLTMARDGSITQKKYWDLDYCDKRKIDHRTTDEMIHEIRQELINAVRLRLRADVPVGIYLSGGLDSSLVAGIVKHLMDTEGASMGSQDPKERITALTIEFDGADKKSVYNEASIASRTAKWLGVRQITVDANEQLLADNLEDFIWHGEQVTITVAVVAKLELSKRARESGVKVILTGEGADEHFAGYPWCLLDYLLEPDYSQPGSPLVPDADGLPDMLSKLTKQFSSFWSTLYDPEFGRMASELSPDLHRRMGFVQGPLTHDFEVGKRMMPAGLRARAGTSRRVQAMLDAVDDETKDKMENKWHPLNTGLYGLFHGFLANKLLTINGDRTEMANSLEGRPSLLDHKLAELVAQLPPSVKIGYCPDRAGLASGQRSSAMQSSTAADSVQALFREKWIMREVARPFVTDEIYERPKHGFMTGGRFAVGGPVHRLVSRILTRDNIERLGFLDYDAVQGFVARVFDSDSGTPGDWTHCLIAMSYVILSQKFGVPRASLETGSLMRDVTRSKLVL